MDSEVNSEPTIKKLVVETSEDKPKAVKKNNGASIIKDWVSDSEEEDMPQAKIQKKIVKPSFTKIEIYKSKEQVKSPRKTTVKKGDQNRQNTHSPRGNQRNWSYMMSQRLGSNFEMINKACYVCGSFDHLQYDSNNHQRQFNNKNMVKPEWNYTQRVNHQNFSRMTHPSPKRNMVPKTVLIRYGLVSLTTAKPVNTAQPKTTVNSARPMINIFNKAHSTVRRPINNKTSTKNSNFNQRVNTVSDFEVNWEEGYVALEVTPKRKSTDRGKITTVPRKNNMYNVDLKNIVPKGGLTCLFAKATSNESKLWHRRLGHINFKTMNKLVKGNLVRGLPSKLFENDQTSFSGQKGKQHRASCKSKTAYEKDVLPSVIDEYIGIVWVFFLATKDETSGILKSFITGVENLIDQRVKVIRCDNGTEFKNKEMNQFCERKAVNTACYVQNRVLVTKPHNKTPYELFLGRKPALGFMRPFGCPVTILNTIDHLGKFDGKADEGFFVGENTPNIAGSGPNWLFDIDALTKSMSYKPVVAGNQSNSNTCTKACDDADDGSKPLIDDDKKVDEDPRKDSESIDQEKDDNVNSTNNVNAASTNEVNVVGGKISIELPDDLNMPTLEDIVYSDNDQDVGAEANMNNLDAFMPVSPIPTTRVH
ncbi:putative ribonuclease H-like domain-containing protein, partial [Tanacetum coccineum]